MTTFYAALRAELERVDASTWRDQLEGLHASHGSWRATAAALDVTPRTLERWRNGYLNRRGERIQVKADSVVPRIREAVKGDRKAQLARVDWSRLRVKGTIELARNAKYRRKENMHIGKYLEAGSIEGLAAAYLARSAARVQNAIDNALSEDYVANGDTRMLDVEELDFTG